MLISYPATLLKKKLGGILQDFLHEICIVSENTDNFTSWFPTWMPLIYLHFLSLALAKASNTMLSVKVAKSAPLNCF